MTGHNEQLERLLDRLAEAALALVPSPGPVGRAAEIAAIAFDAAADMARDGRDPVAELSRIHGVDPLMRSLGREAERRFPQSSPALEPEAPDTVPFSRPPPESEPFDDEESRP